MKEQIKNGWKKVKTWVGNHKAGIAIGFGCVVAGVIGAVVTSRSNEPLKDKEVINFLESTVNDEIDENDNIFESIDRYVIDRDLIDKLPAGTYDVFDMYENERVDYVVEDKG